MKKSAIKKMQAEPKVVVAQQRKATKQPQDMAWQVLFSKRLPHRVGHPLSSSGCGDGSSSVEQ